MPSHKGYPYLITKSLDPENQESPIHFLPQQYIPSYYFFRRNHFSYPVLGPQSYTLPITGEVINPYTFTYNELFCLDRKTLTVVLECAGNKRSKFDPRVYGEQWEEGAISQGQWQGVSLSTLLSYTGLSKQAKEVVFEGWDVGEKTGTGEVVSYQRSLSLAKALHPDTIIAYAYNGKTIPYKHGFPFRLIVPEWYAMASVKWLKNITVIDHSFEGPFQTDDYVYYPNEGEMKPFPVTTINVNSTIQYPLNYTIIKNGVHRVHGIAWTGKGEITNVQISFDEGNTWQEALIETDPTHRYTWCKWSIDWRVQQEGEYTIQSRAIDSKGRLQPQEPHWNKKGYGYNAVAKIHVKVE
ncbi:sulfite oxidase [Desertibacillus haloalkaliphilus]|nr:sulfite oxidase [Desertibacillus haloalkaliphilus]